MAKFNNEIKTGIVVVAAILVFMYISAKMGGVKVMDGYELNVLFNYVSGLEDKAPVKLAGGIIGEVKKVTHVYDNDETKVLAKLSLNGDARDSLESTFVSSLSYT